MNRSEAGKLTGKVILSAAALFGSYEAVQYGVNNYLHQLSPTKEQIKTLEGNILFMNGGKIGVKFGVDLPTEDGNGNVYQTQNLPGTAHPDITISNPIIVLQTNEKGEILTYYRFFYRSEWRLIPAKDTKPIKEADNGRNGYAVSTKILEEYGNGKPAQLILSNGKVVYQTIEGDDK